MFAVVGVGTIAKKASKVHGGSRAVPAIAFERCELAVTCTTCSTCTCMYVVDASSEAVSEESVE